MRSRLIIADDHAVLRQGLRDLVAGTPDLQVVAEASDGPEAERLARTRPADLLLLDVALPLRRGLQVLESLRRDGVTLPVLVFSMYPAEPYAEHARRAGAQGFVSKDADSPELLRAIRRVLAGGTSFPARRRAAPPNGSGDPFARLSARELEVMNGLLGGSSLLQIAAGAGITPKSVTTYRRRLLDKLGVRSNAELATLAARYGKL
jgi:DNA-binding NarL/FixJ family response regulator